LFLHLQGGIKNLFALTTITEIGDVKRFAHPLSLGQLVSWAGMDIREYASGGKSNRLAITRQGNRYLRKVACAREMVGFVNASNDLEGKTEIGKSTQFTLAERAVCQHAVPEDR
jgi:transposase